MFLPCEVCGRLVRAKKRQVHFRVCTEPECKKVASRTLRRRELDRIAAERGMPEPKGCEVCGTQLPRRDPYLHCCSQACKAERERRLRQAGVPEVSCDNCGKVWRSGQPAASQGRFCDAADCRRMLQKLRMREYAATKRAAGVDIYAPHRKKQNVARQAKIAAGEALPHRKRYPESARAADLKRRAIKKGVEAETINSTAVYERDGWACGICGHPVSPEYVYPDRSSPSLDHIVPLSLGGAHSWENVRCSHLYCNVKRGTNVDWVPPWVKREAS